jgi:L-malate glycosyltransferase
MKIVIFIENNLNGGLDTFCSTLINNWPNHYDRFIIICNESHPGRSFLTNSLREGDQIILHKIPLSWVLSQTFFGWLPSIMRRMSQPFLRLFLVLFQLASIKTILKKINGDALLVINGGYPAGETCRLANIVWYSIKNSIVRNRNIHNFHNFSVNARFGFGWYENLIDKKLLNAISGMVSVSETCSASIHNRPVFTNYKKVKTIYNGAPNIPTYINGNVPDLRKLLAIGEGLICILLANYEQRKGHSFLFNAFNEVVNKIPNAHLICCGASYGNEKDKISDIRSSLPHAANIHLLGFFPDGRKLISQADVVVISSQYLESFGLTAIEAMLESVPVVATKVGGLKEVLGEPSVGGFLVDSKNVNEFSKRIIQLLSSHKLRKITGKEGKERAEALFSARQMANKYNAALFKNFNGL